MSGGSYAAKTKAQLIASSAGCRNACCRRSLLYGILLFSCSGETRDEALSSLIDRLMREEERLPDSRRLDFCDGSRILASNFQCGECRALFLRGAFLSCGGVIDPARGYRLELTVRETLADDLGALLESCGMTPLRSRRRSYQVLYFKESENIEDFLNLIGAHTAAFGIMNEKIYREFRNNANRLRNCDTANIGKAVSASLTQLEAIKTLEEEGRLSSLDDELQETARLRSENPDISLSELAALHKPPITKSGANHRLQKLVKLAGEAPDPEPGKDGKPSV